MAAAEDYISGLQSRLDAEWTSGLRQRGSRFIGDEANVLAALRGAPVLKGLFCFNEFKGRVEIGRCLPWRDAAVHDPWLEVDDLELQGWLQVRNIDVRQRGIVSDCVERVARDECFHPVRDYLADLTWDRHERLPGLLQTHFCAEGTDRYLSAVGTKFFISAVARVMKPGAQADHVLVLEGPQGCGKTSSVRILGGDWVGDGLPNLHDKDAALALGGVWLVELAELTAMRKSDVESTKAFISRTSDRIRPPYGRRMVDMPRQCVFLATTNEGQYLRDPTGNRRFWPVSCGQIDLDALRRDRNQIWAEAVARYVEGEMWHLTAEEASWASLEQSARVMVSELEQRVVEHLDGLAQRSVTETCPRDILITCLGFDEHAPGYVETAGRLGPQIATVLGRHGWKRVGPTGRGPNRRVLYRLANSQGFIG